MGRSRRIVSSALTLAIAAIAGLVIGEVIGRCLEDPAPHEAIAAPAAPPTPTKLETTTPQPLAAKQPRSQVLALDVDRTLRLDGATLGVADLATALRGRVDVVYVAPGAGVPWSEVVELVDRLRELGVRVSMHDVPPE